MRSEVNQTSDFVKNNGTESPEGTIRQEEIAARAHQLWKARGGVAGSPEQDWFRAEAELNSRRQFSTNLAA